MTAAKNGHDERTPLLNGGSNGSSNGSSNGHAGNANGSGNGTVNGVSRNGAPAGAKKSQSAPASSWLTRVFGPPSTVKILLAGFIISLSFSFTQVPIFYVFHLMECDVYYETHPPHTGPGDRCSLNEIAAGTATQFSILGMSTTFCGTWNLFVAGWTVKRWGPRFALVLQTFIPAIRVAAQIIGVVAGGAAGITIIQSTQLITVLGGPAGYILVVNTLAGELVEPLQRTAVFGQLQGCIMLGQAIGLFLGGMVGDAFGIRMPFQVAFFLFCFASLYAGLVLPYVSPESLSDGKVGKGARGLGGFLAPLRVLAPQLVRLPSGRVKKHYGVLFLCMGVFLGVLATGYAPILIQMYATAVFDFNQADNGWLMSGNALMRSFFLILIFPKIISLGRKWWVRDVEKKPEVADSAEEAGRGEEDEEEELTRQNTLTRIPSEPQEFDAPMGTQAEEEPVALEPIPPEEDRTACHFDLFFLRWSLVVDGALTAGAALATKSWHVYLAAFLLPFGSGSAPAAKGVITEMCPSSQRADALNAITLVENIARLATLGLFGFVFSALAEVGKAYLTFFCNAAIAVVGMAVLCFSHFPPDESVLVEEGTEDLDGDDPQDE
ncbi:Major facilitator superfamily transporter [Pleurostoma richardsiae]|uniref:Major facilitator superfamily transporter n=1 Tax=Pleurostoma richardsiae TaxID=41990 RepID=A0AA38VM26_9PEZI|nr:Major facilitator superfamily transporter [Pleurostoma richardsiae]